MKLDECKNYFDQVISTYKKEIPLEDIENFEEKISQVIDVFKFENDYIYIIVKDNLSKLMITKFYSRRMDEILQDIANKKVGFKFITEEEANKEKESNKNLISQVDPSTRERSNRKLRAEFTFDNFVIGDSNRFAFITAMKVAETPYSILNPLYMFGDVGLGKTHLMMAIGHYILDKNINANVVYTSAQQFTEDFFIYTKKNSNDIEYFYNKYRSADILLVDDIQLLEGKPGTQEEFFKVFDYLHENNKQIVITSDRMANDLKLMNRLKSRFSWGMPVDIQSPDRDLRINILKRKLETLLSNPKDVPIECLETIADLFTNNIRELEGALRRFVNYCVAFNIDYTLENAKLSLEAIISTNKSTNVDNSNSQAEKVKSVVASYFNIPVKELSGTSRKQEIVYARSITIYLLRTKYNVALKKIGEYLGNRDHATVSHAIDKIEDGIKMDEYIKQDVDNLVDKLNK